MDSVGLKIGGSVTTYKEVKYFPFNIDEIKRRTLEFIRLEENERIARYEILPVTNRVRICILGFGVGPFGHCLVERWRDLEDKSVVHRSVSHYCSVLVKIYNEVGLKLEYDERYSPNNSCFYEEDVLNVDKLADWAEETISKGSIPVTHGDMVPVKKGKGKYDGLKVASADQLVPQLAVKLGVKRIIAGTNVNGLYTDDPKTNPKAKLIRNVSAFENLRCLKAKKIGDDVTGRVPKKVEHFQEAVKHGIEGYVVNALVEGRIRDALLGKKVYGTLILP
jgi:isopentenyl phosphate kinase